MQASNRIAWHSSRRGPTTHDRFPDRRQLVSSTAPSISKSEDKKYVYSFGEGRAEGNARMKDILGGKGAGLAEMTNIGVPVPPGFTISTEVCTYFYEHGKQYPPELRDTVAK